MDLRLKASIALVGEDLQPLVDACIEVHEGFISRVSRGCNSGGYVRVSIVTPLAANAHVHTADYRYPDYGTSMSLEELVAPPAGLKHRLLSKTPRSEIVEASAAAYRLAEASGTGLIIDFREPAAGGCSTGREAASRSYGIARILVLGRPGDPGEGTACDGVGLNSPLDHPHGLPGPWRGFSLVAAHVAETRDMREKGDLEAALRIGVKAAVHGVHLSRRDLEELAASGVWLVLCPRSNMWHGVGLPPVKDAMDAGVRVALGSDNASWSHPDPKSEALAALYVARLQGARGPGVAEWVLRALFHGGYELAGLEPPSIEEGRRAALAAFTLLPEEEWAVYAAVDKASALVKALAAKRAGVLVSGSRCVSPGLGPCDSRKLGLASY